MSIDSPATAPSRDDLPYLRHRRRPAALAPVAPDNSVVVDFITGRSTRHRQPSAPLAIQPPEPIRPVEQADPVAATSIDIGSTRTGSRNQPGSSGATFTSFQPRPTNPTVATTLTMRSPTVMLNRLQSGIGALSFDAVWSATGDVRLGCAFQLRSKQSTLVRPVGVTGPLLLNARGPQQRLILDLLAARYLDRLILFASSTSGVPWGASGTLISTTFGGDRIEIPLDQRPTVGVMVLLSLYNIDGEFVLRAELEQIPGSIRDACIAFGFDRITWLDAGTAAT